MFCLLLDTYSSAVGPNHEKERQRQRALKRTGWGVLHNNLKRHTNRFSLMVGGMTGDDIKIFMLIIK